MVKLTRALGQISPSKILVIGDFLLDTYTIGQAMRISPEAPVAVLKVESEEHRPGGAGNVALNLLSLGSEVVAVGRVGDDEMGKLLVERLSRSGVDVRGMQQQQGYSTPVKNRVIANQQQIVRIDREKITPISLTFQKELEALLPSFLQEVDVVAISDYGKGLLSESLLRFVIKESKLSKIPVIVDPKGVDFSKYFGATVLKPNLVETYAAANLLPTAPLEEATMRIMETTACDFLLVTRAEAGSSLFSQEGERCDFSVKVREVKDVTGAGDTVLAVLAWGLANRLEISEVIQLSNRAASLAVERFGCARISLAELAHSLLKEEGRHKVYALDDFFALIEALRNKRYTLLSLSSQKGFTAKIFQAICQIKRENEALLVLLRDPCPDLLQVLLSLREVDFIIQPHKDLEQLTRQLTPEQMYVMENEVCRQVEGLAVCLQGVG